LPARSGSGLTMLWGYNANNWGGLGDSANRGDGAGEMGDNLPAVKLIGL